MLSLNSAIGQDPDAIREKINHFKSEIVNQKESIRVLEYTINSLEDSIELYSRQLSVASKSGDGFIVEVVENTDLWKSPNVYEKSYKSIPSGSKVLVIAGYNKYFVRAIYGNEEGFVQIRKIDDITGFTDELEERRKALLYHESEKKLELQDSISAAFREQRKIEEERRRIDAQNAEKVFLQPLEKGAKISISVAEIAGINSAGGINMHIRLGHLLKEKEIKYILFTGQFYNAVGDPIHCTVTGKSDFRAQVTGPIKYSASFEDFYWEAIMYNSTARCVKLTKVEVDYMDGTRYVYIQELPKTYFNEFTNDCTP